MTRMEQRITLTEDELRDAQKLTGIVDPTALVRHVLNEYVKRLRLERLAKGGFSPDFEGPPRRRPPHFRNDLDEDGNPLPD
ncbi:MAG: type II toxin-antitoxin system VapB family antitoxin [Proteobacteria bacterium]|nr:type II toxin-antitoxin system VapB family antitoxin [Pseudomonadota bacterium]